MKAFAGRYLHRNWKDSSEEPVQLGRNEGKGAGRTRPASKHVYVRDVPRTHAPAGRRGGVPCVNAVIKDPEKFREAEPGSSRNANVARRN